MSVRTACPYCGVGCGVRATPDGRSLTVEGDPNHPANLGRLCSKGSALGSTVGLEGRLLHPMIGTRRASWSEALARGAGLIVAGGYGHGRIREWVLGGVTRDLINDSSICLCLAH